MSGKLSANVIIGSLQEETLLNLIGDREAILVGDQRLEDLYIAPLAKILNLPYFLIGTSETAKTRDMKEALEDHLAQKAFSKNTCLLAIGGGTTLDLVGFTAATYLRGVSWIAIPTTLLAMVDVAVGGKTGVNTPYAKNLIGAFHSPEAIFLDIATLDTLPQAQIEEGLAEILKLGCVLDRALFERASQGKVDLDLILEAMEKKQSVVDQDPQEKGYRRILNFGHTVAHALEAMSFYQIPHGQAVAIGCTVEAFLSEALSLEEKKAIEQAFTFAKLSLFDRKRFLKALKFDKKNLPQKVRCTLLKKLGEAEAASGAYCRSIEPEHIADAVERLFAPKVQTFPQGTVLAAKGLKKTFQIPPSKSQTLRAYLFAALAQGTSQIYRELPSPDTEAAKKALAALGAKIEDKGTFVEVVGVSGKFQPTKTILDCGNSGILLRFLTALVSQIPSYTILTGDPSIQHQRPMQPLLEGLSQLGAFAVSSLSDGKAPILVKGPWKEGKAKIIAEDSQFLSALLIGTTQAPFPCQIVAETLSERPWVDLTLSWLNKFGVPVREEAPGHFLVEGPCVIPSFSYTVPGDWSSAAFFAIGALITNTSITLEGLDSTDPQGDKELFFLLESLGAKLEIREHQVHIRKGPPLRGGLVDLSRFIDALPILSVLGCFLAEPLTLIGAKTARGKECDRIAVMCQELTKMGAQIAEQEEGLTIYPSKLKGASLSSHQDHRVAMSLVIASMGAKGTSFLEGVECIKKTVPNFFEAFL